MGLANHVLLDKQMQSQVTPHNYCDLMIHVTYIAGICRSGPEKDAGPPEGRGHVWVEQFDRLDHAESNKRQ